MTAAEDVIRFYFSFRSPYSWLATVRIQRALEGLPVELAYIPVFPPPDFPNDPAAVPNKLKYIQLDCARIADAYGIRNSFDGDGPMDCDWIRPHAAFLYAADQGAGEAFIAKLYDARFGEARNVGDDAVMREAAESCGIDADATIAAADDEETQKRVWLGMMQGMGDDEIFGVPYFVYRGERFWGNDRIDWLVRAIKKAHGQSVVNLTKDNLQPLDR